MQDLDFRYQALPWNILFGIGVLQRLPDELDKLGYRKALVLTTPNQIEDGERVVDLLGFARCGPGFASRSVTLIPTVYID